MECISRAQTSRLLQVSLGVVFVWCFFFLAAPSAYALTLSGTLYSDEGVTQITSGKTITIAVGTSTLSIHSTTTNSGAGTWTVDLGGSSSVGTSTPILVYVDGDATTRAALFTKAASSSNISGLDLYKDRVIISHQAPTTSTSTRITDMSFYDNDNDVDIQYNASSTARTFTVNTGNKLYIKEGKTFFPEGGSVYIHGNGQSAATDGSFLISNNATFIAGATTSIAGSFNASSSATFYPYGTLEFKATTTGKTINATNTPLGNIVFNNTSPVTFAQGATTTNLTINTGATAVAPANLTITGDYTNSGTFTHNSGTTTFMNNGSVWTAVTAANQYSWESITYGNGLFVALACGITSSCDTQSGDRVMTSPDGISWTSRTTPANNNWSAITYGLGSGTTTPLFVAVAMYGTNRVMTSPDGISWTLRSAAEANSWRSVTYGNGLFVAISDDGTHQVMTSSDGTSWVTRTASEDNWWRSVTYGNGLFVAVGAIHLGTHPIMTSSDGVTWGAGSVTGEQVYKGVTYGNGRFVIVGYDSGAGIVTISDDGVAWISYANSSEMTAVTYGDGLFVAISDGDAGASKAATSPDGVLWKTELAVEDNPWISIAYGNEKFVAVSGSSGTHRVMVANSKTVVLTGEIYQDLRGGMTESSSFNTFKSTGTSTHLVQFGMNASTSNLIIDTSDVMAPPVFSVSGNYINNGEFNTLAKVGDGVGAELGEWESITYGNGLFVAVAGWWGDRVITSSDGINWTARTAAGNDDNWRSVTYGDGIFVAVGSQEGSMDVVITSSNGINWTARSAAGDDDYWNSVTYGNGLFVAVGSGSDYVMTSSDGVTWATSTAAADNNWMSVTYGNGLFVAVSDTYFGTITNRVMTSPDGVTWTARTAAADNDWRSVTYGSGLFVAVSDTYFGTITNRVMTSPDGVTWTARTAAADNDWRSVTYGSGLFVAVASIGSSDHIMTSVDGILWRVYPNFEKKSWYSIVYSNQIFVIIGEVSSVMLQIGTTTFNGTTAQTATGTMTGASTFGNLEITNTTATTTFGSPFTASSLTVPQGGSKLVLASGATTTITGTTTLTGTSSNRILLRSLSGGTSVPLAIQGGYAITYTDIKDMSATSTSGLIDVSDGTSLDNGNNSGWLFGSIVLNSMTLTGTLYADEGFTQITTGKTISMAIGTTTVSLYSTTTNSGVGAWTFTVPDNTNITPSTPILIWVDNDPTTRAARFTKASSSVDNITGLHLYQNNIIVSHIATAGTSTRITDMAFYDGDNDSDIQYTSNSSTLTTSTSTQTLYIETGKTYESNGDLNLRGGYKNNGTFSYSDFKEGTGGTTWTIRTSAADNTWRSVTYGDGVFVAISLDGTNRVMTSPDGITWTARTAASANQWYSIIYSNGLFVAVAQNGSNSVMTSPDGITWTSRTSAADNQWASVTYGNGLFVAVANTGSNRVMTSPDGITWTARTAASANMWQAVTYGNGLFVATSVDGTGNRVMTSPDGITWTSRTSVADNNWRSVTYGNGLFVAVSSNDLGTISNRVMTSQDGINWTARTAAANNFWCSITYGNGLFVATSADGTGNRVMTSPDGITWTIRTSAANNDWISVTYGNGLFVAVSYNGTGNRVMTSPVSPAEVTLSGTSTQTLSGNMTGTSAFGNLVVAGSSTKTFASSASTTNFTVNAGVQVVASTSLTVAGNYTTQTGATVVAPEQLTISGDYTNNGTTTYQGAVWTARSAVDSSWTSVTYGNGLFVAVNGAGTAMTSPDGVTWTSRTTGLSNNWAGVTYGNGLFVAVANSGTGNRVMTSPDGITWTSRTSAADNTWYSVTYGNGLFVAVASGVGVGGGYNNTAGDRVMTSPDGITWTSRADAVDNYWYSVTYGNGLFVAVAGSGTGNRVMTSPDGITWTSRTSAADNWWLSVTYGNGLFVAGSYDGTVMTSPDGITWTSRTAASANQWWSITYGNGLFVAVAQTGTGNRVMTSPDGITWTSRASAKDNEWRAVTYGNGLFVAVAINGTGDRVMTSRISTTTFIGGSSQTATGTMTGASAFGNIELSGGGSKQFFGNASTSNMRISTGTVLVAPATSTLSISGDYTNNGLFIAGNSTTTFSGTTPQTATGTLSGTSAFYNLVIQNSIASTTFGSALTATNNFRALTPGTVLVFAPSATTTFGTAQLIGTTTQKVIVRSGAQGSQMNLKINGGYTLTRVDLRDVNACPTGSSVTALNGLDSGNNTCITFLVDIILSGTLYSDEGVTTLTAPKAIAIAVGTTTVSLYSATSSSGVYSITIPAGHAVVPSTPILVWVDATSTVRAALFTKASSSVTDMTSLNLYQDRVIVSHESGTTSTSTRTTDMSFYDYDNDSDIPYTANSGDLTVVGSTTLYVKAGKTFTALGTTTLSGLTNYGTYNLSASTSVSRNYQNSGTTTSAGTVWTSRASAADNQWSSVAYGNNLFVAVGWSGTGNRVMTSPDGITWTSRASAADNQWTSVTYGNGLFVAVANNSTTTGVMTSPDGITWTIRTSAANNQWYGVTYGNGLFVAVAMSGTGNRVMTSPDGITWTSRTSAADSTWRSITYGNGLFVAVACGVSATVCNATAGNRVMTSPDGITWTARADVADNYWVGVVYGNGLFVALASTGTIDDYIMTSSDGITWTARTAASNISWFSITYGNGLFVAGAQAGTGNRVMTSPDGITWTSRTSAADNTWRSVTYGNGLFVAVSYDGTDNRVMTSGSFITFNGTTTQSISGTLTGAGNMGSVAFVNAGTKVLGASASTTNFMIGAGATAVAPATGTLSIAGNYANSGTLTAGGTTTFTGDVAQTASGTMTGTSAFGNVSLTGTSTKTFSGNASTTNFTINAGATAVAPDRLTVSGNYTNNGTFDNGVGKVWVSRTAPQNNTWTGLTYGKGLYVAVSMDGTNRIMTSPDGTIWTSRVASEANTWRSVTYGNGLFVAVSQDGTNQVMTSLDGITWTARTAAEANTWYFVTYGNGLFVAVATTGTNRVMTSPDGITWTARTAAATNGWTSVTYGNGLFVAVSPDGTGNRVMTSPDGITWTSRTSAADNSWRFVTYGNGLFVAVANSGTGNRVMTSPDGITWTSRTSAVDNQWYSVTYGNGLFVAVSLDGVNRVMTSPDGIMWTSRSSAVEVNTWYRVAYGNGLFVATSFGDVNCVMTSGTKLIMSSTTAQTLSGTMTGSSTFGGVELVGGGVKTFNNNASTSSFTVNSGATVVAPPKLSLTGNYTNSGTTSPNGGITWMSRLSAGESTWYGVTYGNALFVAVSVDNPDRVMTSPDGITWTGRSILGNNDFWKAVTYGNGLFVAVGSGDGGSGGDRIATSPDGITWTARTSPVSNDWSSITYGNGLFVALARSASSNQVTVSSDGITWAVYSASQANAWNSVTYGNGLFVAVAQSGTSRVMTSPDGITWTNHTAAQANYWNSVTYGDGLFVAVGNLESGSNRAMTSPDGITWTSRTSATGNDWQFVTYGRGLFVAVARTGTGNRVMTSQDGITWTSRASAADNGWSFITYGNGLFVAVSYDGTNNRVMTAPASDNTLIFNGTTQQTATGTMTGASAFTNVTVANASQNGSTTQSLIWGAPASTTGTYTMLPGTSAQFLANATSTFTSISWGGSSSSPVYLRSSASGTPWGLVVSGEQQAVSYVNVKDSHACSGYPSISAIDGTSVNAGGNTCWSFEGPYLSSASNQVFGYGQATTTISSITVGGVGITAGNDIRIRIATSSVGMKWDTTDTTAVISGTATGKVSTNVSYENSSTTLVLNVTSDFTEGDTITLSGLSFSQFSGVSVPAYALKLYAGGVNDVTPDDTDDKTIGVSGLVTLGNHTVGQVDDNVESNTESGITLYGFSLASQGEDSTISNLTVRIVGSSGILSSDISGVALYKDMNEDGVYDVGDVQVGGTPTVTLPTSSGSIVFTAPIVATSTTMQYILVGTITNLRPADSITLALMLTDVAAAGAVTGSAILTGFPGYVQHMKGGGGGGGMSGDQVPSGVIRTGGSSGGGDIVDTNTGGVVISNEPGYAAPTSHGVPQGAWTTAANGYNSDGQYATANTGGLRHTYKNFALGVPMSNTVSGIEVMLESSATTPAGTIDVKLSWDGGSSLTTLKQTNTLTATDEVYTLGGPGDTWGRAWAPSELTEGNFAIEVIGNSSGNTVQIDAIRVRVYHEATGGGSGGGAEVAIPANQFYANVYSALTGTFGGYVRTLIKWLSGF